VRLLVGLVPGGGTDIMARMVSARLSEELGQRILVDNRPGSGGLIAADIAAKATPDGYTLLFGSVSYNAIFASAYKKLPYDPVKDFAPISLVAKVPNVLVVSPSSPSLQVRSVSELIAFAKAHPGKLRYGSSGNGSSLHLSMELLKQQAGIDLTHVPYKGGAEAVTRLMGDEIQAMFDNTPGQIGLIRSGRTRALAVTSIQRNPQLPEVPTMIESGVPGFEVTVWYGVFAPARVEKTIITRLNAALVKTLNLAALQKRMTDEGAEPSPTTPNEFAEFQKAEIVKWAKIVKAAGVAID
jgi:tripartite-type tricarboxylate transporter receptor subunit TctC